MIPGRQNIGAIVGVLFGLMLAMMPAAALTRDQVPSGIHQIKHVVFFLKENHTFDN